VPRSELTLEVRSDLYVADGEEVPGPPFVEIAWFDRGLEMQDRVAAIVTQRFQQAGCPSLDVCFHLLDPRSYYEDGKHF